VVFRKSRSRGSSLSKSSSSCTSAEFYEESERSPYSQDEALIDILLSDVGVEIGTLDKAEEEFIDDL